MANLIITGNYDVSQMHYEGPQIPGGTVGGYGYEVRTGPSTTVVSS